MKNENLFLLNYYYLYMTEIRALIANKSLTYSFKEYPIKELGSSIVLHEICL